MDLKQYQYFDNFVTIHFARLNMYWIKYKFHTYILKRILKEMKKNKFFSKFLSVITINVRTELIFFLMELYVNIISKSLKYMYMLMS